LVQKVFGKADLSSKAPLSLFFKKGHILIEEQLHVIIDGQLETPSAL